MKLNIAFKTLLAAICTASQAHARVPSRLRDPRTVEEKEEVHRQTMGDHVLSDLLNQVTTDGITCEQRMADAEEKFRNDVVDLSAEEAKSLACTAVSNDFEVCQGCQGFSQVGKEVHIPGCVGMTSKTCEELAKGIVQEKPFWFKDGNSTSLVPEDHYVDTPSEMAYYKLGLPVSAADERAEGLKAITGVAGKCMVHYSWDWCVLSSSSSNGEDTACLKLQPWDCSKGVDSECLSSSECCAKIQGEYPKPDINGNELQCYEWVLPVKSSSANAADNVDPGPGVDDSGNTGSSGGVTGNRLVIHLNGDKVALPAVITDGNYQPLHDEEIMVMPTPAPTLGPFSMLGGHGSSKTIGPIKESTGTYFPKDISYVMTERSHTGDENGNTYYKLKQVAVEVGTAVCMSRSQHKVDPESKTSFSCTRNKYIVERRHYGDENGYTYYWCAEIVLQHPTRGNIVGQWINSHSRGATKESSSDLRCSPGYFMTGRYHAGDENAASSITCRQVSFAHNP